MDTTATQIHQLSPEMQSIRHRALAVLADHPHADDAAVARVVGALTQRAFLDAIAPLQKVQADLYACGTGAYRAHSDGRIEHMPQSLTPEQQRVMDLTNEMIAKEAKRFEFPASPQ